MQSNINTEMSNFAPRQRQPHERDLTHSPIRWVYGFEKKEWEQVTLHQRHKFLNAFLLATLLALIPVIALHLAYFGASFQTESLNIIWVYLVVILPLNLWVLRLNRASFKVATGAAQKNALINVLKVAFSFTYLFCLGYVTIILFAMYLYRDRVSEMVRKNLAYQASQPFKEDFAASAHEIQNDLKQLTPYLGSKSLQNEYVTPSEWQRELESQAEQLISGNIGELDPYSSSRFHKRVFRNKVADLEQELNNDSSAIYLDKGSIYTVRSLGARLRKSLAYHDSLLAQVDRSYEQKVSSASFVNRTEAFLEINADFLAPVVITSLLLAIVFFIPCMIASTGRYESLLPPWPSASEENGTVNATIDSTGDIFAKRIDELNEMLKDDPDNLSLLEEKVKLMITLNRRDFGDVLNRLNELKQTAEIRTNVGHDIRIIKLETFELEFFGTLVWDFENTNILLGKNGYGKSHLLTLIVGMLQRNDQVCRQFFGRSASRDAYARLVVDVDGVSHEISFNPVGFIHKGLRELGIVPVLALSELRFIDKSKETLSKPQEDFELKKSAYHFIHRLPLGKILDARLYSLCLDLDSRSKNLELLGIIESVYDRLTGNTFRIIEAVRKDTNYQLLVQTDGNSALLPIQRASQGTLSVLSMVCLIYKFLQQMMDEAEIKFNNKVHEHRGIVIIDEIDAHLHPNWQQNLMEILKTSFPNVQFIIASHSPLIVAGSKENEVNVLRKSETGFYIQQIKRHFIGVTIDQLYESIFEIEDKDETFKKYAAMIPLRNRFEEEILKIEDKRKLKTAEIEEFETLLTKQTQLQDRINMFKMLRDKSTRTIEEEKMFQSMCSKYELSVSSDESTINDRLRLTHEESVRLQALTNRQQLDRPTKQRLDTLYDHMHYINIVENLTDSANNQISDSYDTSRATN